MRAAHGASIMSAGGRPKSRPWHCFRGSERSESIVLPPERSEAPLLFTFAEDAHWSAERQAVEFGVEIGEYRGIVRVPHRVFQRRLRERPTPRAPRRGVLLSANPVRGHRRMAATAPVDRGWERGDQRAGPALSRRWETVPPARGTPQIDQIGHSLRQVSTATMRARLCVRPLGSNQQFG